LSKSTTKNKTPKQTSKKNLPETPISTSKVKNPENYVFSISGALTLTRAELKERIAERGFKVTTDIKNSTHLICNDPFFNSEKVSYAKKNGILLLHENYFL